MFISTDGQGNVNQKDSGGSSQPRRMNNIETGNKQCGLDCPQRGMWFEARFGMSMFGSISIKNIKEISQKM